MNKIFHHKHQKLILQCYPAGKAVDKKPNSSELSYLLYYASTRRVKLEKVIIFLKEKTNHDAKSNKSGNLQVTLIIVKDLINKCSENLNVFAQQSCDILFTILNTKDVALCKVAVKTYGALCDKLDGALFSGDKDFVKKFTEVSQLLISFGKEKTTGLNQYEWQMISLMAINDISKCLGHNATVSKKFIALSVPTLIQVILSNNAQSSILQRLKSNVNIETDKRLSRIQSHKSQLQASQQIEDDFNNDSLTLADVTEEAFTSMKSFFNTNTSGQISEVTRTVVQHNITNNVDMDWGVSFLELCITWIPVQLRFVGLSTLLVTLSRINIEGSSKSNFNIQYQYSCYLLGLLSSKVNMIGLSVSDIIQQLLNLQCDLILKPSDLEKSNVLTLTNIYSDCICNLTTHIYYYDQVPDSIQEILVKVDFVLDSSFVDDNTNSTGENIHDLIIQLLDNISKIFMILKKQTSSINRNHVNLEHWDISLGLLAPESEFEDDRKTVLTTLQINDIQAKYLKVFDEFLNNELAVVSTKFDYIKNSSRLDPGLESNNNNDSEGGKNLMEPDVNQYITHQQNFISHFLMYVDKFFENYNSPNTELVLLLVTVLKHMSNILGINFLSNYIPFFHHWVLKINKTNEFTQGQKFKDTIAHIVLYHVLIDLDQQYEEELEDYCKTAKLFKHIQNAVEYRKKHRLWIHGIDELPTDKNFELYDKPRIKADDIEDFACGNNFLIVWLHPQKPLLTEIEKSQISTHMSTFNNDSRNTNNTFMPEPSIDEVPGNFVPTSEWVNHTGLSSDVVSSNSEKGLYTGLGLGTAGDITSIHQEILQFSQHFQERGLPHANGYSSANTTMMNNNYDFTNGSIYTYDSKHVNSPTISDLKDAMSAYKMIPRPSQNESIVSNGSVLNKNLATTDVNAILDGLESDDDAAFVV
ncbi:unnamed protein product [Candida verbasci]|uniref:Protein EFR3 n=1 Tax=Candida verbasci TaxID=1227364 RepID=A0A9W4TU21_9ASCO|nr:unnamed protein product [Candida verbasci]